MSGPKNNRGDAFGDFFGDPTPSGSLGPLPAEPEPTAPHAPGADAEADDQPTRAVRLPERDASTAETPPTSPATAGAVPEGWWAADPDPTPTPASSQTWHAAPIPTPPHHPSAPPPRRGVSPFALVAMLIGGVLIGALCVGGVILAFGDNEPAAAPPTTVTATSTDPTTSDEEPSTSSSTSSSSSSSPTRSGTLPSGATKCSGPLEGTSVGRGSEMTSCAFADAVRDAYLAKEPEGDVDLEVRSPVTNKTYTMSCTGESVTRCTGGNNAVVYLY